MNRPAALILFACGIAVAAPVPVTPAKKMKEVYGEIADKQSDCTFGWEKGALKVTVPAAEFDVKPPWRPQVAKSLSGDFVVVVRVALTVPDGSGAGEGKEPFVSAGVAVSQWDAKGPRYCLQLSLQEETANGKPKWRNSVDGELKFFNGGGAGRRDMDVTPDHSAVVLRLTRKGDEFTSEYRHGDGEWERLTTQRVPDLPDTLEVGPVAFGNIDQAFTATFDQYEIKPLPKAEKK